jgi:oxygen-dependent protoporphyrinogen oxidase
MPFLPMRTKLRASLDLILRSASPNEDESVTAFVSRHLGRDFFERLVQPIVSGIYSGDPDRLSALATLGPWVALEKEHKSLIRAVRARTKKDNADGGGARYSLFVALRRGMQALVDALERRLCEQQVNIIKQVGIKQVVSGQSGGFDLVDEQGATLHFDGVILTTPAYRSAELVATLSPEAGRCLEAFNYASASIGTYLYRVSDIERPLDAFGIVVPRKEQRVVMASTWSHIKYPGRAPDGYAIIRAYAGDAISGSMPSDAIDEAMRMELSEWLSIRSEPLYKTLSTYRKALPQYEIGHASRVQAAQKGLSRWPQLRLAGIAYEGTGLSDAVASGERAAQHMILGHN